jgi:hypothetical protein
MEDGAFTRDDEACGTRMYSAWLPSMVADGVMHPKSTPLEHRLDSPFVQKKQEPQAAEKGTITWSPIEKLVTEEPSVVMCPTVSWPQMNPGVAFWSPRK